MSDVLIVDDEPSVRRMLRRWIDGEGMTAVEAESAEQALLLASQNSPMVALCDINLPRGKTGFWLIEQLHRLHPETAVVVTTGAHDLDHALKSVRAHVTDYVVKPFTRAQLTQALSTAMSEHAALKGAVTALRAIDGNASAVDPVVTTVAALLAVLQAQSEATARHAVRVSEVAVAVAEALGVADPERLDIGRAALLRDIERLDVYAIARLVPFLAAAAAIVAAVGEHFDGTGFPLGLKGDAIPLGARIIAVADAYVALVGHEDKPVARSRALTMLSEEEGTRLDPSVLRALTSPRALASPA